MPKCRRSTRNHYTLHQWLGHPNRPYWNPSCLPEVSKNIDADYQSGIFGHAPMSVIGRSGVTPGSESRQETATSTYGPQGNVRSDTSRCEVSEENSNYEPQDPRGSSVMQGLCTKDTDTSAIPCVAHQETASDLEEPDLLSLLRQYASKKKLTTGSEQRNLPWPNAEGRNSRNYDTDQSKRRSRSSTLQGGKVSPPRPSQVPVTSLATPSQTSTTVRRSSIA